MGMLVCPHCSTQAQFTLRNQWTQSVIQGGSVSFGVWTCEVCGWPVVGEVAQDPVSGSTPGSRHWPLSVASREYDAAVPSYIAENAREAHICQSVGAHRGAAAMARRSLQASVYEQADKLGERPRSKKLVDQIDWLQEKRLIPVLLKDVAHQIRLGGNLGAHPDEDGLKDVGEPEANAVLAFMDSFIQYVYELPARVQRAAQGGSATP